MNPLPLEIQSVIAAEHRQRALAWHSLAPDLCGCPIRHYTPRMRLDLELSGNAFAVPRPPQRRHIQAFLWRLSPGYALAVRPQYLPRRRLRFFPLLRRFWALVRAFGSIAIARRYYALERHVDRFPLAPALLEILAYRESAFKDRPPHDLSNEEDSQGRKKTSLIPKPQPHWCDDLVWFFAEYFHFTRDETLDTPFAQLYQLWRARAIAMGGDVIDNAAELASEYAARKLDEARALAARN